MVQFFVFTFISPYKNVKLMSVLIVTEPPRLLGDVGPRS